MPEYGTLRVNWEEREIANGGMVPDVEEFTRLRVLRFLLEPNPSNEDRHAIVYYDDNGQLEFYSAEQLFAMMEDPTDLVAMVDLWLDINRTTQAGQQPTEYNKVQQLRSHLIEEERVESDDTARQSLLISVLSECFAAQLPDSPAARDALLQQMSYIDLQSKLSGIKKAQLEEAGVDTASLGDYVDEMRDALRKVWAAQDAKGTGPKVRSWGDDH